MTEDVWSDFSARMREIRELRSASALLAWDQETCLPAKASEARGRQIAALEAVIHERLCAPALGEAITGLAEDRSLPPDRAAMVRNLGREVERARKLPAAWGRALAEAQSAGLAAWREARGASDFSRFAPKLETQDAFHPSRSVALRTGAEPFPMCDARHARRSAALRRLGVRLDSKVRPPSSSGSGRRAA